MGGMLAVAWQPEAMGDIGNGGHDDVAGDAADPVDLLLGAKLADAFLVYNRNRIELVGVLLANRAFFPGEADTAQT